MSSRAIRGAVYLKIAPENFYSSKVPSYNIIETSNKIGGRENVRGKIRSN
jgi:predicted GTPase